MTDEEMIDCPEKEAQLTRLRAIMHRLRAPGGCPWDAEQTHESLVSNLIEEAYETVAAIRSGDVGNLREELGDLLLQVVFHSELAEEAGDFDFDEVARGVSEKLVRRHPHVFARSQADDSEAVLKQWDEIKRAEKGHEEEAFLHGVGDGLPALLKAVKLQKKAGKVGFDWPDAQGVVAKVEEELGEVKEELAKQEAGAPASVELRDEIGDLLFIVANLARKVGVDPELALEGTNGKFLRRFGYVESTLRARGRSLTEAGMAEMDAAWEQAKSRV
ncbi:MAG: nucleoside triphosphate pyrophosphohydrolase [Verrucomicrobiales bacterium]